jgi:hypothetical protein
MLAVNGEQAGEMAFDSTHQIVNHPLPAHLFSNHSDKLILEFTPLDARTPAELGLWDTHNPVSVYIYSIELTRQ